MRMRLCAYMHACCVITRSSLALCYIIVATFFFYPESDYVCLRLCEEGEDWRTPDRCSHIIFQLLLQFVCAFFYLTQATYFTFYLCLCHTIWNRSCSPSSTLIDLLTQKPLSLFSAGAGALLAPPAVSAQPPGCLSGLSSQSTPPLYRHKDTHTV